MTRLLVGDAALGYADHVVCQNVSVAVPDQRFTVIVGPNACGKSTLLKSLTGCSPEPRRVLTGGAAPAPPPSPARSACSPGTRGTGRIRVVDLVSAPLPHQRLFSPGPRGRAGGALRDGGHEHPPSLGTLVDEPGGQRQRV